MGRRLSILLGLLILGTILLSLPLLAQSAKPDIVLSGRYDGGKVYLKWAGLPGDSVRMNYVYRGLGGMLPAFSRIDSTTRVEYVDQPPSTVAPPLTYYVTAAMKNGTTRSSNVVEVRSVETVKITSIPRESGAINTLYMYQVSATSTDPGASFKYQLSAKPERMTVDSVRGLIQWTPLQRGFFKVVVLVTSSKGGRAEQAFTINVSGPAGGVSGTITDLLGKPVANVAVLLIPKTAGLTPQYKGYTDLMGMYTIGSVDSGSYLARAIPTMGTYPEQWYDGVTSQERATVFQVKPNATTIVNFNLNGKLEVVQITSRPLETAALSVSYAYQVLATSSDPAATLKYQLSYKPDNMAIDSVRGLVTWVPKVKGSFKVAIVVTSSKGGRAEQSFGLTVTGPAGSVSGIVKDTLGRPVSGVYIQLYQVNGLQAFDVKNISDLEGKYTIGRVDSGKYLVRAIPSRADFAEQWYDGAATVDKATPIVIVPNGVTTVNVTLRAKVLPPQFTVRGTVLDESKKVLREATVVFSSAMVVSMSPNSSINPSGGPEFLYKVRADSAGRYSIKLPQGTYTAMATAPGFAAMFFDGKTDALTANLIRLTKDTSGINFALRPVSSIATGKISGSVIDSATKSGLRSKVIAYRMQTTKPAMDGPAVYPAEADSTGAFSIANLLPGDYIVLAMPLGSYAPTYYSQAGSTTNWERATKIGINGNSVTGITIIAKPLAKTMRGYNSILGVVSVAGMPGDGGHPSGAAGAIVYALLSQEEVAGFGIADEQGNFAIEGLDPGLYTLAVDKVNFASFSSAKASSVFNSTVDASLPTSLASLTLTPVFVTEVGEKTSFPSDFALGQNYPNPFNPSTAISYQLSAVSLVTLKVFNTIGEEVATLVNEVRSAGTHIVRWNANSSPSGIYFYRLQVRQVSGGQTVNYLETKKMILLR